MRIHLDVLAIQCPPDTFAHQANIDGLILFVDTWLMPFEAEAKIAHDADADQTEGMFPEAAPMSLGRVAVTRGFLMPAHNFLNSAVSEDWARPGEHAAVYEMSAHLGIYSWGHPWIVKFCGKIYIHRGEPSNERILSADFGKMLAPHPEIDEHDL